MMKITNVTSMNQEYLSELKSLADDNIEKPKIVYWYSAGLLKMIATDIKGEKNKYFNELQRLLKNYPNDASIIASFCDGLVYMMGFSTELEKKKELLSQIECLAHDAGCDDSVCNEAKHLYDTQYIINGQIFFSYCKGLLMLLQATPDMDEKKNYLSKIKKLVEANPWFPDFATLYSHALFIAFNATSVMEEKSKYLIGLKYLLKVNSVDPACVLNYCKAIFIMSQLDEVGHDNYMAELYRMLSNEKISNYIATNDPSFIRLTNRELLDFEKNKSTIR